jgi:hypothetical protein
LHTGTDDHANAPNNYLKSDFSVFKVEGEKADQGNADAD